MNWSYARKNKIKTICKWNEVFKEYQISRASNYHRVLIYYASALYYYYRQSDNLRDEGQCSFKYDIEIRRMRISYKYVMHILASYYPIK